MSARRPAALLAAAGLLLAGCSSAAKTRTTTSTSAASGTEGAAAAGASGQGVGAQALSRPFASSSPWNTTVSGQPSDPRSQSMVALASQRQDIEYTGGLQPRVTTRTITAGLFINTDRWSDTIAQGAEGVPTSVVCRQQIAYCGDGAHLSTLNIPAAVSPQPQYDGWMTVLEPSAGVAYDLWRARRSSDGHVVSYQYMRRWSLTGSGYAPPGSASARGSGLPLFAGLITPTDIQTGKIEHALAISLPGPARGRYAPPASATDGVGPEASLPEGARIRLRADFELGRLSTGTDARAARAIVRALKLYGAIVVDRARVPTLYAQLNYSWQTPLRDSTGKLIYGNGHELPAALQDINGQGVPLLRGNEVQSLRLSDFEVLSLPGELSYPPPETASPGGER
ncbi:MAG TPA: hypothetical protein VIC05_09260 [Solirubrobacteraceae bacterium]|jgi:hypothetical protein